MGNCLGETDKNPGGKNSISVEVYGLQNYGNTCYINSVLQVLYRMKNFRKFMTKNYLIDNQLSISCTLSRFFGEYNSQYRHLRLKKLIEALISTHVIENIGTQQCASFFIYSLLNSIKEENDLNKDFIDSEFTIKKKFIYECRSCKNCIEEVNSNLTIESCFLPVKYNINIVYFEICEKESYSENDKIQTLTIYSEKLDLECVKQEYAKIMKFSNDRFDICLLDCKIKKICNKIEIGKLSDYIFLCIPETQFIVWSGETLIAVNRNKRWAYKKKFEKLKDDINDLTENFFFSKNLKKIKLKSGIPGSPGLVVYSLLDLLEVYNNSKEKPENDLTMFCGHCEKDQSFYLNIKISNVPKYLLIVINQTSELKVAYKKLKCLKFEEDFNLSSLFMGREIKAKVIGYITYSENYKFGHYTASIKTSKSWCLANDSRVTQTNEQSFEGASIILMRIRDQSDK